MTDYLCISATFMDPRFHGRGDGGEPEWPPSPLRVMQALVAGSADQIGVNGRLDRALEWLEGQPPPLIVAPRHREGTTYCLSVPNNAMDLVGKAWARGNYFGTGDSNPATHRTMKTVRPIHMLDGQTVHFLWAFNNSHSAPILDDLVEAAQHMVALGWGIDMVVGSGDRISSAQLEQLPGERWRPTPATGSTVVRVPVSGTLSALTKRYNEFVHRIGSDGFVPVTPLTKFDITGYRRPRDPARRPCIVFELRNDNGSFCSYSQRKLIHIAGMIRHLAKEVMQKSPPSDVPDDWVERYIVGHQEENTKQHRQLSYLPLPSIGHYHADQAVRRVVIAAPVGDDAWLEHLARCLSGQQLRPDPKYGAAFGDQGPPTLMRVHRDKVASCYTQPEDRWASVTPVILPGHDDRKPDKTRKLIEAALAQSGVEQPCTFEWSAFSRFRKSLSAHKYGRDKRSTGYLRPSYLQSQTTVHLTLKFNDGIVVPGPLVIGAGRHCGFGLMAGAGG